VALRRHHRDFLRAVARCATREAVAATVLSLALCPAAVAWTATAETARPRIEISDEELARVSSDRAWRALLHVSGRGPDIRDPGFLLTSEHFSPASELRATIAFLYEAAPQNVCRFPARYFWLRARLPITELPVADCAELEEFRRRAPADAIDLVFASENLAQPSSAMGHLFLKLSGTSESGSYVSHSVSFYTDTATLNLPKLFWDSLVSGKRGLFALAPYSEQVHGYVERQHRNLWEYRLALSDTERLLLQAHLIELKQTTLTYYFQKFNCATLIQQILAIAAPSLLATSGAWSTPRSVLRAAREAHLTDQVTAIPAARWTIRALAHGLPQETQLRVRDRIRRMQTIAFANRDDPTTVAHEIALARAYNDYLAEQRQRSRQAWRTVDTGLEQAVSVQGTAYVLEASASADPAWSPPETQIYGGIESQKGTPYIRLGFLPVSHQLVDDNTHYGVESEFRLFDFSLLQPLEGGRPVLDELTVYSVTSLLPRDLFTGGVSGSFRLGSGARWSESMQRLHAGFVDGSIGGTIRAHPAVDAFGRLGGGLGYRSGMFIYPNVTAGIVMRERWGMKSLIITECGYNEVGTRATVCDVSWRQSAFLSAHWSLSSNLHQLWSRSARATEFGLLAKYLF